MNYQFSVQGIKCHSCVDKITQLLQNHFEASDILFKENNTQLSFTSQSVINPEVLNPLLAKLGDYTVSNKIEMAQEQASYRPIYLIVAYLLFANLLIIYPDFHFESFMTNFMASFFLVFSFFKLLDLKGFAESYASYDIVAKKFRGYAYLYPFIELAFGAGYLLVGKNLYLNIAVFVVMAISSIGVIQAKLSKKKFQCACVGTFLKVPLGSIAILEDITMTAMSLAMIILASV